MSDKPVPHIVDGGLLEILQAAQEGSARDLASEIKRLQAQIASLEEEIKRYQIEKTPLSIVLEQRIAKLQEDNASLGKSAADALRRLQESESKLAQVQAEIAGYTQEVHRLRAEEAAVSETDLLSAPAKAPVDAQFKLASLTSENERLRADRFVFADRAARVEEHNRVLAENATKRERNLQHEERELTRAHIRIVNLETEASRLRAEHSALAQQAAALVDHNRLLTESATDLARKLERCEAEMTQLRSNALRFEQENQMIRFEHDRQAKRASDFQAHVHLLTESATETARRLQQCEAELTQVRIETATLGPENHRLRAERAALATRMGELENHNRLLTEAATETARKLQDARQADYQLIMAQQQLLAGMKDAEPRFHEIYERCRVYTMTSVERLYALYKSVEYVVSAKLPGDLLEVGVWRGGSCMLIAETLLALGDSSRRIFLCDTFAGHPRPDANKDVDLWGNRAIDDWRRHVGEDNHGNWGYVSIDEVRDNLGRTGYPADKLVFVQGLVEETVPNLTSLKEVSILRLDTDWYASTKTTLEHLYPRLASGGVLIIDDYGHYKGQQLAVDEYFASSNESILLNRIDYSCRLGVKGLIRRPLKQGKAR